MDNAPSNSRRQKFRADLVILGGLIAPNRYPDSIANSNRCGLVQLFRHVWLFAPPNACEQVSRTQRRARSIFIRRATIREVDAIAIGRASCRDAQQAPMKKPGAEWRAPPIGGHRSRSVTGPRGDRRYRIPRGLPARGFSIRARPVDSLAE